MAEFCGTVPPEALAALEGLREFMRNAKLRGRVVLVIDDRPDRQSEWHVALERGQPPNGKTLTSVLE